MSSQAVWFEQEGYDQLRDRLICEVRPAVNAQKRPDRLLSIEEMHDLAMSLYHEDSREQAKHMDPVEARWLFHPTPWDNYVSVSSFTWYPPKAVRQALMAVATKLSLA